MPLQRIIEREDQIPTDLKAFYVAKDGKFVLDVEGGEPAGEPALPDKVVKVLELERKQRADAVREREALKSKVGELENAIAALRKIEDDGGGSGSADPKLKEELKRQLVAQKGQYDEQIRQLSEQLKQERTAREQVESKFTETRIVDAIRQVAIEKGVRPDAVRDAIGRARDPWRVDKETGKLVAYDGDTPIYSRKDPTQLISLDEHMEMVVKEAPFLLKQSQGIGAAGNGNPAGTTPRQHVINRVDAKDPIKYRAAREAADKAGAELRIEG